MPEIEAVRVRRPVPSSAPCWFPSLAADFEPKRKGTNVSPGRLDRPFPQPERATGGSTSFKRPSKRMVL